MVNRDYFMRFPTGYGYYASKGKIQAQSLRDYGIKCKLNDIVTMIVDLDKQNIRYRVNNQDLGVAFDYIPSKVYKIALYLYGQGSKAQILQ